MRWYLQCEPEHMNVQDTGSNHVTLFLYSNVTLLGAESMRAPKRDLGIGAGLIIESLHI